MTRWPKELASPVQPPIAPIKIDRATFATALGAGIARAEYRFSDFGTARFDNNRSCAGSATLSDPGFGTVTVNCFQTDLVTNSLRLQSHIASFGLAYKFN